MPFPNEFYFTSTQCAVKYSDNPTGVVDVGRLVQGRRYWRSEQLSKVIKGKTLVLSDWRARLWDTNTIDKLCVKLVELIDNEFRLFVWQNGSLIGLTKDNLSCLFDKNVREQIIPEFQAHISKVAAEHHIAQDQLFFLDDYCLTQMLSGEYNPDLPRAINITDLINFTKEMGTNERERAIAHIIAIMQRSNPPIKSFTDDRLPPRDTSDLVNFLKAKFPQILIMSQFQDITLNQEQIETLLSKGIIIYEGENLSVHDLLSVKKLKLKECTIDQGIVDTLFCHLTALNKLEFSNCSIMSELTIPSKLFGHLETLSVQDNSSITYENFRNLTKTATKLTHLSIRESKLLPPNNADYSIALPSSLEYLDFTFTELNDIILSHFFANSLVAVKTILLHGSNTLVSRNELNFNLPALEFLNFSTVTNIDYRLIEEIIGKSPALAGINIGKTPDDTEQSYKTYERLNVPQNIIEQIRAVNARKETAAIKKLIWVSLFQPYPDLQSDPVHDSQTMKDFKPEQTPFSYNGKMKSKNQGMLINQLSQYLTLIQKNTEIIPSLQDGICLALVNLYKDKNSDFSVLIDSIAQWDGQLDSLDTQLRSHFELLLEHVKKHYLKATTELFWFAGDNLSDVLNDTQAPIVFLSNPWHVIALKNKCGSWYIYDPNFVNGERCVDKSELSKIIERSLGTLVLINEPTLRAPTIADHNAFIEKGGLLVLCNEPLASKWIEALPKEPYSKKALDGILLRDTKGHPAWYRGLRSPNCASFVKVLLEQFIKNNPEDWQKQLNRSMECLSGWNKLELITSLLIKPTEQTEKDTSKELITQLILSNIHAPFSIEAYYERLLQTWSNQPLNIVTPLAYAQSCANKSIAKKRLIQLSSQEEVQAMSGMLSSYLQKNRPIFTINSPDDLI